MLNIIGLGVKKGDLSISAYEKIKQSNQVVLRTENTNSAQVLKELGINYQTLDHLYQKSKNFDTLTKNIVKSVKDLLKNGDVCYLVDGAVSEDFSSKFLLQKIKDVTIFEGVSKCSYYATMSGLSGSNYQAVSAYNLDGFSALSLPLIIYDLDNQILASEWKLKLFDFIGEEQKVRLYVDYQQFLMPLYEIDTLDNYNYSTVLVIDKVDLKDKTRFNYDDLIDMVKYLRSKNGCPWHWEQDKKSISKSIIEEGYELLDAINADDDAKICEETGDVLFVMAFYINFLEEDLYCTKNDLFTQICNKVKMRNSHVFGGENAKTSQDAIDLWLKNKQIEKHYQSGAAYLEDVPKNFPAAMRCQKVIKRANDYNYKIDKTVSQNMVEDAITKIKSNTATKDDFESLIFACISLIKDYNLSAEDIITNATNNFIKKFSCVENAVKNDGKDIKNLTETELWKYRNGN